jgi:hypothetical protein
MSFEPIARLSPKLVDETWAFMDSSMNWGERLARSKVGWPRS